MPSYFTNAAIVTSFGEKRSTRNGDGVSPTIGGITPAELVIPSLGCHDHPGPWRCRCFVLHLLLSWLATPQLRRFRKKSGVLAVRSSDRVRLPPPGRPVAPGQQPAIRLVADGVVALVGVRRSRT